MVCPFDIGAAMPPKAHHVHEIRVFGKKRRQSLGVFGVPSFGE